MTFSYDDETGELVHNGPSSEVRLTLHESDADALEQIAEQARADHE